MNPPVRYVKLSDIYVDRENRQRRDLPDIEELAASILEIGLINPVLVTSTPEGIRLIAGERRFRAHEYNQADEILCSFKEDLDPVQQYLIELEENVQRVDLSWQDKVKAVSDYHVMRSRLEADWSESQTAEALRMSQPQVNKQLLVRRAMDENVNEVIDAPKFSTALNFASRREERKKTSAKRTLLADLDPVAAASDGVITASDIPGPEELAALDRYADIRQANFLEWSLEVQHDPFNFLHVDFPYGVNIGNTNGQSAAGSFGGYDDAESTYTELLTAFNNNIDRFCAPSAHLMFWFSMDYYQSTLDGLRGAGWRVDPFPLIWFKSDNTGIIPDPNRGPRRVYETAFFATRGDRKIVRATGNAVGAPTPPKDDKIHASQKSGPMLEHFFRMLVDENTRFLDPTAGSGAAVGVAEALGAEWSLGLELNEDYVTDGRTRLGLD